MTARYELFCGDFEMRIPQKIYKVSLIIMLSNK